jgi:transposase
MAATSYLYHCFGLIGYTHLRTEYQHGHVYHHVELQRDKRRCRGCNASWYELVLAGKFTRTFYGLPVGRRAQFVVLHGHEQCCAQCNKVLREPIGFTDGKQHYLKSFARLVQDLCALMPIKHVARYLGVGWDMVKNIYKKYLRKKADQRSFRAVRYIAVDEFAIRKGHNYLTIVMDLETGAVLFAAEGRDEQAILPFFKKLKRIKAPIKAVAMDMWQPYMNAVETVFEDSVDIVHDPYHVVTHANKALDQIRRDIAKTLEGEERSYIKGTRYLLLKGLEKLSMSSMDKIMELMVVNAPLYAAYLMKEELRMFWNCPDKQAGETFLATWIADAQDIGLKPMLKIAKMLERHKKGLLSYFQHRISTGPLEGLNNKLKVLKRQAYGFRDNEYFKLRLYFLHKSNAVFTG